MRSTPAPQHGAESRLIRLNELKFRACEGYYSKAARACTWPCSITQMDEADQMDRVYEALVHWADAIIVASPIRWGAASSLYFKMAERLNCVQNAITIRNQVLIRNKVAGFIIVGGQDNIQGVAGQMLGFFAELGFIFPQFPYIAHSRGWSSEDMERNVEIVRNSAGAGRRRGDAGQALHRPGAATDRARRGADLDRTRRPQGSHAGDGKGSCRRGARPSEVSGDRSIGMAQQPAQKTTRQDVVGRARALAAAFAGRADAAEKARQHLEAIGAGDARRRPGANPDAGPLRRL